LRILELGRFDFEQLKGGVQFYSDLLVKFMNPQWTIDQLVSSTETKTDVVKTNHGEKIRVASYGQFASVPLSPGLFFRALKLLWTRQYDILHLNFPDPWGLLVGFLAPPRTRIVVTWHSDIIRQKKMLLVYQPFVVFFMKFFVDKVLVATKAHIRSCLQLKACGVDRIINVTPFGVETEKFVLKEEQREFVQKIRSQYSGQFILFALGRHVYYKGFEHLIGALKGLSNVVLLLGGQGPLTEVLRVKAKGLPVQFLGLLSEKDVLGYLHSCDLFCFPSVDATEAYGYAQIEAMMCGKPVLGTFLNNGVNEVNLDGVTGLCVEHSNADALREGILEFKNDPALLLRLANQAKERAWQQFSARETSAQTEKIFLSLKSKS
jgi:glycosyltransferase involved in cell wall biosynthesis